jgi:hypothetical protein
MLACVLPRVDTSASSVRITSRRVSVGPGTLRRTRLRAASAVRASVSMVPSPPGRQHAMPLREQPRDPFRGPSIKPSGPEVANHMRYGAASPASFAHAGMPEPSLRSLRGQRPPACDGSHASVLAEPRVGARVALLRCLRAPLIGRPRIAVGDPVTRTSVPEGLSRFERSSLHGNPPEPRTLSAVPATRGSSGVNQGRLGGAPAAWGPRRARYHGRSAPVAQSGQSA